MNFIRVRGKMKKNSIGRCLLRAMSLVYGLAVSMRNLLYQLGFFPVRRLRARIIGFGNLTVGGTGKTSAVLLAAEAFKKRHMWVAILSRGYRRLTKSRDIRVLSDAHELSWQETGDEPWMMHRALKGLSIPIFISQDRYRAGRMAIELYGSQVLLLDDGFQHRKLKRDLDILLVNALDPFGGEHLLPLGNLREPLRNIKRAHVDQVPKSRVEEILQTLHKLHSRLPVIEAVHKPDFLFDIRQEIKHRVSYLKGKRIACFSGIGEPRPFEAHLRQTGAELVQIWRYPDHHPYSEMELRSMENVRQGLTLITTFKDVPRLPDGWQRILSGEVLVLAIRMEIIKGKSLWEEALYGEKT
jgi:tetraacyldisaccharide 4'-kinase